MSFERTKGPRELKEFRVSILKVFYNFHNLFQGMYSVQLPVFETQERYLGDQKITDLNVGKWDFAILFSVFNNIAEIADLNFKLGDL